MAPPASNAVPDARYWSTQMAAVSAQRDRASCTRIYDHFAPRLQRYLCNLSIPESMADELVQEALLTLWRKASVPRICMAATDAPLQFSGWVARTLRPRFGLRAVTAGMATARVDQR